jgi:DNA-binding transcriptional ArsR family regulator
MNEKDFEKILKALANKRRLLLLNILKSKKEMSVGDLAIGINLSFRATSRHLRILLSAGLVECEQKSTFIFYKSNRISIKKVKERIEGM